MPKLTSRSYSTQSAAATRLLGLLIKNRRVERRMTVAELAERAGVSRGLVQRVEAGEMGSSIGVVFELASIIGVPLFTPDPGDVTLHIAQAEKTLSLLPRAVFTKKKDVDDDF